MANQALIRNFIDSWKEYATIGILMLCICILTVYIFVMVRLPSIIDPVKKPSSSFTTNLKRIYVVAGATSALTICFTAAYLALQPFLYTVAGIDLNLPVLWVIVAAMLASCAACANAYYNHLIADIQIEKRYELGIMIPHGLT